MSRFVPIYSEEKKELFLPPDVVPPREVIVRGHNIVTAPLAVWDKVPLLGLSMSDELIHSQQVDTRDTLDDVTIHAVYFLLRKDDVGHVVRSQELELTTSRSPLSLSVSGDYFSATLFIATVAPICETEKIMIKAYVGLHMHADFDETHVIVQVETLPDGYEAKAIGYDVSFRRVPPQPSTKTVPTEITWEKIRQSFKFSCYEYANDIIAAWGGIPPNCEIEYASTDLLNGIVNYLSDHRGYFINRHGRCDYEIGGFVEPSLEDYSSLLTQAAATLSTQPHADISCAPDDVIVFAQSENSYYSLWFDRSARCSIARVEKTLIRLLSYEQFIEMVLRDLAESYMDWRCQTSYDEPIIVEIPKLNGNIRG